MSSNTPKQEFDPVQALNDLITELAKCSEKSMVVCLAFVTNIEDSDEQRVRFIGSSKSLTNLADLLYYVAESDESSDNPNNKKKLN